MSEEVEKILDSVPRHVLNWVVQGAIGLIFAMLIYIFNGKLDEIDNKFTDLKSNQVTIEQLSNVKVDHLTDQETLIITQMNDIKLKLALLENILQSEKEQRAELARRQQKIELERTSK